MMRRERSMKVFWRRNGRVSFDYKKRCVSAKLLDGIDEDLCALDHGSRVQSLKSSIGTGQCDAYITRGAQKPRSDDMAATTAGTSHLAVASSASHMCGLSPALLQLGVWQRRLHYQDLGLRAGRARAHSQVAHEGRVGCGLWRAPW